MMTGSLNQFILFLSISLGILFNGCSSNTEPGNDPLTITFETTNASYMEANDGAINLTVIGGVQPYGYIWSNGAVTEDIDQLTAGVYHVTVTDADQTQVTDSTEVTEPDNIARVIDIDGNVYKTIKIGEQWWMAENLKVTHNPEGDPIESCIYENDPANELKYGRLYTWDVAMDSSRISGSRGIAPEGWHIPSIADWNELITFLGGAETAGGKMKLTGLTYWDSPNTGATNSSGFAARAGGEKEGTRFQFKGQIAIFWSSNQLGNQAYYFYLSNDNSEIIRRTWNKDLCYSIRCVKD